MFIYSTKPYKSQESHIFKVDDGIIMGVLNRQEFLNVTFENSPMEVELKLIEK